MRRLLTGIVCGTCMLLLSPALVSARDEAPARADAVRRSAPDAQPPRARINRKAGSNRARSADRPAAPQVGQRGRGMMDAGPPNAAQRGERMGRTQRAMRDGERMRRNERMDRPRRSMRGGRGGQGRGGDMQHGRRGQHQQMRRPQMRGRESFDTPQKRMMRQGRELDAPRGDRRMDLCDQCGRPRPTMRPQRPRRAPEPRRQRD
jgi:hypothetical protein